MLPASDIAEIISSLASLKLEPATTAAVLGAVLTPLLRSVEPEQPPAVPVFPRPRAARPRAKPRQAAPQKRKYQRGAPDARARAHAALKANPGISWTRIAAIAKCSRSTVRGPQAGP